MANAFVRPWVLFLGELITGCHGDSYETHDEMKEMSPSEEENVNAEAEIRIWRILSAAISFLKKFINSFPEPKLEQRTFASNFIMIRRHSEMNTEPLLFLFIYLSDRSISQPIYLNPETHNHPLKPLKSWKLCRSSPSHRYLPHFRLYENL